MNNIVTIFDWDGTLVNEIKFTNNLECIIGTLFKQKYINKSLVLEILKNNNYSIITARCIYSMLLVRLRLIKDFYKYLTISEIINILLTRFKVDTPSRKFFYKKYDDITLQEMASIKIKYKLTQLNFSGIKKCNIKYIDLDL